MSGQCYRCAAQFGLFKKESGCKNCGYSFCGSCLKKKSAVPKIGNSVHKVCDRCYDILSGKVKPEDLKVKMSPPENFKKRLHKLQNPDPIRPNDSSSRSKQGASEKKYAGFSQADRQIAERLDKLKEARRKESGPVPTSEEVEERLRKLKGEESTANQQQQKFYQPPDTRTQQEQINDLLDEIHDTVEIESHWLSPEKDVSQRLAQLRGEEERPVSGKGSEDLMNNLDKSSDSHPEYRKNINPLGDDPDSSVVNPAEVQHLIQQVADDLNIDRQRALISLQKDRELWERLNDLNVVQKATEVKKVNTAIPSEESNEENEEAAKNIIRMVLEEQALEKTMGRDSEDDKEVENADDELPWCCICNADGVLRCQGCDDDIYCQRCFREGHDAVDRHSHTTSSYRPTSKIRKGMII